MIYFIIAMLLLVTGTAFALYRFYLPTYTKNRAQALLTNLLFPGGEAQKEDVLRTFHEFTNNRFSHDQILDYFIKIKGLQTLNINVKSNFWIKKYLLSPTDVRLNYFEQVKFYETFMNYPKAFPFEAKTNTRNEESKPNFPKGLTDLLLKKEYA